MSRLFENYEVFYNMLEATSVMTNTFSPDAVADCEQVIAFIGEAYGASVEFIDEAKRVILDELACVSTVQDFTAFDAAKCCDRDYSDFERYAEVKNDIVLSLENLRKHSYLENPGWVNYSHYCVYQSEMRFRRLSEHSITGDLISTRTTAILLSLGIGCERDIPAAQRKLLQCALWGDLPSARYLAYTAMISGDPRRGYLAEYSELLNTYLAGGITVLPDEAKERYSSEACLLYVYTSSIKYDVVYSLGTPKIDFSFLEVIMSDIPFAEKMTYIDEYDRKVWKKRTNSVNDAVKSAKIGFGA